MRGAKIEDGIVTAIWEVPALNCFGESLPLVEAPEWVSVGASYNLFSGVFTNPAPTRDQQLATIERDLQANLAAGVEHLGVIWHSDATFQSQLTGFVTAFASGVLPSDATVRIRAVDNSLHDLGATAVKALAAAVMSHVQTAYAASWAAKDALA